MRRNLLAVVAAVVFSGLAAPCFAQDFGEPPGVGRFNRFLDRHDEVANELRSNPGLLNDPNFVGRHPGLQNFLSRHPGAREDLYENPNSFVNRGRPFGSYGYGFGAPPPPANPPFAPPMNPGDRRFERFENQFRPQPPPQAMGRPWWKRHH